MTPRAGLVFSARVMRSAWPPMILELCEEGVQLDKAWGELLGKGCEPV